MPPVTVSPWREVLRADTFGPVCPQNLPEVIIMLIMLRMIMRMMVMLRIMTRVMMVMVEVGDD